MLGPAFEPAGTAAAVGGGATAGPASSAAAAGEWPWGEAASLVLSLAGLAAPAWMLLHCLTASRRVRLLSVAGLRLAAACLWSNFLPVRRLVPPAVSPGGAAEWLGGGGPPWLLQAVSLEAILLLEAALVLPLPLPLHCAVQLLAARLVLSRVPQLAALEAAAHSAADPSLPGGRCQAFVLGARLALQGVAPGLPLPLQPALLPPEQLSCTAMHAWGILVIGLGLPTALTAALGQHRRRQEAWAQLRQRLWGRAASPGPPEAMEQAQQGQQGQQQAQQADDPQQQAQQQEPDAPPQQQLLQEEDRISPGYEADGSSTASPDSPPSPTPAFELAGEDDEAQAGGLHGSPDAASDGGWSTEGRAAAPDRRETTKLDVVLVPWVQLAGSLASWLVLLLGAAAVSWAGLDLLLLPA